MGVFMERPLSDDKYCAASGRSWPRADLESLAELHYFRSSRAMPAMHCGPHCGVGSMLLSVEFALAALYDTSWDAHEPGRTGTRFFKQAWRFLGGTRGGTFGGTNTPTVTKNIDGPNTYVTSVVPSRGLQ